jgi:hypothetical protein
MSSANPTLFRQVTARGQIRWQAAGDSWAKSANDRNNALRAPACISSERKSYHRKGKK